MKKIAIYSMAVFLLCQMPSCSLNPSWILNPKPTDWDADRGIYPDTAKNRAHFTATYHSYIEREASGEDRDWVDNWKRIFEALDQNNDNPAFYKNWVIQERRKRGLPELKF